MISSYHVTTGGKATLTRPNPYSLWTMLNNIHAEEKRALYSHDGGLNTRYDPQPPPASSSHEHHAGGSNGCLNLQYDTPPPPPSSEVAESELSSRCVRLVDYSEEDEEAEDVSRGAEVLGSTLTAYRGDKKGRITLKETYSVPTIPGYNEHSLTSAEDMPAVRHDMLHTSDAYLSAGRVDVMRRASVTPTKDHYMKTYLDNQRRSIIEEEPPLKRRHLGRSDDTYFLNEYEIGMQKVIKQYNEHVTEFQQEVDPTRYDDRMVNVPIRLIGTLPRNTLIGMFIKRPRSNTE